MGTGALAAAGSHCSASGSARYRPAASQRSQPNRKVPTKGLQARRFFGVRQHEPRPKGSAFASAAHLLPHGILFPALQVQPPPPRQSAWAQRRQQAFIARHTRSGAFTCTWQLRNAIALLGSEAAHVSSPHEKSSLYGAASPAFGWRLPRLLVRDIRTDRCAQRQAAFARPLKCLQPSLAGLGRPSPARPPRCPAVSF